MGQGYPHSDVFLNDLRIIHLTCLNGVRNTLLTNLKDYKTLACPHDVRTTFLTSLNDYRTIPLTTINDVIRTFDES